MRPPGGTTPAPSAPTPTVPPGESGLPLADYLAAARILASRGWPEAVATAALETYHAQGVVGLRRRVERMSAKADATYRGYFTREARAHRPNRRGDIISLRTDPRWPWRVTT